MRGNTMSSVFFVLLIQAFIALVIITFFNRVNVLRRFVTGEKK